MELALIIVAAALTFGVCYLVDKGYTQKFRSAPQHLSGLSVRLNRRYGVIGLMLMVLGVAVSIPFKRNTQYSNDN